MKKILLSLIVIVLLYSMTMTVFATRTTSGAAIASEERLNEILNNPSPERIEKENESANRQNSRITPYWIGTTYSFVYYGQSAPTTCGVASIQMALHSMTGSCTYSQSQIIDGVRYYNGIPAGGGGMYISGMMDYINSIQSANFYIDEYLQDLDSMSFDLYRGLANHGAPPIVGITEQLGWPYPNSGNHYVTIYQITSDESMVGIADPLAGYYGNYSNSMYTKSMSDLHYAYSLQNIGYMW